MKSWSIVVGFALVYYVLGMITGALARTAHTPELLRAYRQAAWIVIGITFLAQIGYERGRRGRAALVTAGHAAAALALYALLASVTGPVRAHWGTPTQGRAVLALVLWPILAGVPSFFAAWAVASWIRPRVPQPKRG